MQVQKLPLLYPVLIIAKTVSYNMKYLLITILILTDFILLGQEQLIPNGYEILSTKTGDLDNDGIDEKVIVYDIKNAVNLETREIQILKSSKGIWNLWQKSRKAIYNYGDVHIDILNGTLIIFQSNNPEGLEKWFYKDTYRFQNNKFVLIEYKGFYGYINMFLLNWSFDILTGKIECKKEYIIDGYETYKTEKETFYKKNIKLNLNNRYPGISILSPKHKIELDL